MERTPVVARKVERDGAGMEMQLEAATTRTSKGAADDAAARQKQQRKGQNKLSVLDGQAVRQRQEKWHRFVSARC